MSAFFILIFVAVIFSTPVGAMCGRTISLLEAQRFEYWRKSAPWVILDYVEYLIPKRSKHSSTSEYLIPKRSTYSSTRVYLIPKRSKYSSTRDYPIPNLSKYSSTREYPIPKMSMYSITRECPTPKISKVLGTPSYSAFVTCGIYPPKTV